MDLSRLSVVVPARDGRDLTLRCLGSLAGAMASGAEVVLVDDASADDTGGAVRARFPAVLLLRHEEAQGFTVSANEGLRRSRGGVLLLLNSDAQAEGDALPRLLGAFDSDPGLGVASPLLLDPGGGPQWSGGAAPTLPWLFFLASGLPALLGSVPGYRRVRPVGSAGADRVDWVTGAAMAIRRRTWDEVGPFDTRFRFYAQDLDFCLRARDAGWRVRLVDGARVVHVGGATIGRRAGSAQGAWHPGLLWSDLLLWAEKRRGRRWALSASRRLSLGGRLRLIARAAARPFVPRAARPGWRRDDDAFRLALEEVRRWRRPAQSPGGGYDAGPGKVGCVGGGAVSG